MSERFFLATPPAGGTAVLEGDEARHLARVLRAQVGDAIVVFDGRGGSWDARVASLGRERVTLDVGAQRPAAEPAAVPLTIAVALPKGDRQKWMVEKLTELGVARMVPLRTARGVAEATEGARIRLERGVIEACKQCGRDTLMEIAPSATVAGLVAALPPGARGLVADPRGGPLEAALAPAAAPVGSLVVLVGPEGGFADDELAAAEAGGFDRVTLSRQILRIETAAVAAAARLC